MYQLPEQILEPLKRINEVYFSDPGRTIELAEGEQLVGQGEECHRVYFVKKGCFAAFNAAKRSRYTDGAYNGTAAAIHPYRTAGKSASKEMSDKPLSFNTFTCVVLISVNVLLFQLPQ